MNNLGDYLAVSMLADHDVDFLPSMAEAEGQQTPVPESVDNLFALGPDGLNMLLSQPVKSPGHAHEPDDQGSQTGDEKQKSPLLE